MMVYYIIIKLHKSSKHLFATSVTTLNLTVQTATKMADVVSNVSRSTNRSALFEIIKKNVNEIDDLAFICLLYLGVVSVENRSLSDDLFDYIMEGNLNTHIKISVQDFAMLSDANSRYKLLIIISKAIAICPRNTDFGVVPERKEEETEITYFKYSRDWGIDERWISDQKKKPAVDAILPVAEKLTEEDLANICEYFAIHLQ